jgi:hypothetical protein
MLILDKHKAAERMLALAQAAEDGSWATTPEASLASPRSRSYQRIAIYERRPERARVDASAGQSRATRQPAVSPLPHQDGGQAPRRAAPAPLSPIVF